MYSIIFIYKYIVCKKNLKENATFHIDKAINAKIVVFIKNYTISTLMGVILEK